MDQPQHTPAQAALEGAVDVLFCLVDDAYRLLNLRGDHYGALKRLSNSEILALVLLQQLGSWRASGLSCATPRGSSPTNGWKSPTKRSL